MKLNYRFSIYLLFFLIAILFFSVKIIDFSLKKYTRHHSIISVPSLIGLDVLSAQDSVSQYDLKLIILDSAAYNPNYTRGSILEHTPKANSQVKVGRKIYLTINPLRIQYIPLPDLKNKSLRQAISLLESNAFRVGNLNYMNYFAKDVVRFSKVNNQVVYASDSLPKFTVIDLYVGDGYTEDVKVPNLIGLKFNEIKRRLNSSSLNLGECYFTKSISDTLQSTIYKQEPIFEDKVPLGAYISVWLQDSVN